MANQTDDFTSIGGGEIMPSPDEDGCCGACNPYVPINVAPMVRWFNIFIPGVGTIIAAHFDPNGLNYKAMTCGAFQIILTPVVIGWLWSIA